MQIWNKEWCLSEVLRRYLWYKQTIKKLGKQDKGVVEAKLGCDFTQNPIAGSSGLILQGNGSVTNASELLLQEAMAQVFLAPAPAVTR